MSSTGGRTGPTTLAAVLPPLGRCADRLPDRGHRSRAKLSRASGVEARLSRIHESGGLMRRYALIAVVALASALCVTPVASAINGTQGIKAKLAHDKAGTKKK